MMRSVFVDHYRAPLAQRLPFWALPALGIAVAGVLIIAVCIVIGERHQRRAAEQATCVAKLETIYVRNPLLRAGRLRLADPCAEWRAIAL
jgi:hypothetical protein